MERRRAVNGCRHLRWKDRPALLLTNGLVQLVALNGGGHLAEFRFCAGTGFPRQNVLWEAPWRTIDPTDYNARLHAKLYGPPPVGQFISGYTGHALCLDTFGMPSKQEAREGLPLHGEAASRRWLLAQRSVSRVEARARFRVSLPIAGLLLERALWLRKAESLIYVRETVSNLRSVDHFFEWTQHATFGPPLLEEGESLIVLSGTRGRTWPHGYERKALLADNRDFRWPRAPALDGSKIDLARPFLHRGKGLLAAVLLNPEREHAFIAALNFRLGLLAGYCFRRCDFPWVAIWEENCARTYPPWNGTTRARGLEFGSTPMPLGKQAIFFSGPLFRTPTFVSLPARGRKEAGYVAFLAAVPKSWRRIRDVQVSRASITVVGPGPKDRVKLRASSLGEVGLG